MSTIAPTRSDWKPPFVFPASDSRARPTEQVRALRYWYQTFSSTQKFRIVGGNRLSAWQREMDTAPETLSPQAKEMAKTAAALEALALRECQRILDTMPIWTEWLHHVRGIDVALGGAMLSLLLPPRQDKTVASWYKAAGLDVVNASPKSESGMGPEAALVSVGVLGSVSVLASEAPLGSENRLASDNVMDSEEEVASDMILGSDRELASDRAVGSVRVLASGTGMGYDEQVASDNAMGSDNQLAHKHQHPAKSDPSAPHMPRYQKGQTATWHPQLRRTLYLVGESLVRSGHYYREFYLEFKVAYTAKHPEKPPWLLDRIARWRAVKLLLSHLWDMWAEMDGIPHTPPYPIGILGHAAEHYRLPPVPQAAKM